MTVELVDEFIYTDRISKLMENIKKLGLMVVMVAFIGLAAATLTSTMPVVSEVFAQGNATGNQTGNYTDAGSGNISGSIFVP
jgi:hypothetical protein